MTASFARMIVIPVAANASGEETVYLSDVHGTQATTAAARILFAGKSAGPVFELSRHWHTQREQIENAAQEGEDPEPEVVFVKQVAEAGWRSDRRHVGKEGVSTCRTRWSAYH